MNDAETIAGLARAGGPQILSTADGRQFLLKPEGMKHDEVTNPRGLIVQKPAYVQERPVLQTRDSLVDYVNRYSGPETVLFADIGRSTIVAVVDYHPARDGGPSVIAERAAHRASLTLSHSEEWTIWKGIDGKLMPQLEFARFIEENAPDITAPTAGDLLDAVRDLQARRKVNFIKAVRTASDNENFEFQDETEAKTRGGLELPSRFQLGLAVYFGEPASELYGFLRWKLDDGVLFLGIKLNRAEQVRQAVFKQIVTGIAERTKCPVVYGMPG